MSCGCTLAVATRGPLGAVLFDGQAWFGQAPQALAASDTLGAGDAFISGFLVTWAGGEAGSGPAASIEQSLARAAGFAAEVCQVQGAFGHGLRY